MGFKQAVAKYAQLVYVDFDSPNWMPLWIPQRM